MIARLSVVVCSTVHTASTATQFPSRLDGASHTFLHMDD